MPYKDKNKAREANRNSYHKYKEARTQYAKDYYNNHRDEKIIKSRAQHLKSRYNLTMEQFIFMWNQQEGKCYICRELLGEGYKCHIDHDHVNNRVRKLLCKACNNGIGFFKESEDLLQKAADYIREH